MLGFQVTLAILGEEPASGIEMRVVANTCEDIEDFPAVILVDDKVNDFFQTLA